MRKENIYSMKERLFIGKGKRTKIFALITPAILVVVMGLNLLLTYFGVQKTIFFDMTPEGLYSLSDAMEAECEGLFARLAEENAGEKITVTFCNDPDRLISSDSSRLIYFMALKLANRYPDYVEVKTENVYLNPTAVSKYKTTSLSKIETDDVIVSYGDRYRIASYEYFWADGKTKHAFYNGEYRIATLMRSVAAIAHPVAYFVTDHGESYYDPENPDSEMSKSLAEFASLLHNRGLDIKLLDLSSLETKKIPDDCALLIINNPRTDFTADSDRLDEFAYISDTEMLDRYLVSRQGAIMVAKDYEITLPTFESFLYEWGFDFSTSVLVDNEASLTDSVSGEKLGTSLIASYDTSEDSYGYAIYGEYADLSSAPLTVFENAGSVKCSFTETTFSPEAGTGNVSRQYAPFLTTSKTAQHYIKDEKTGEITGYVDGESGQFDLAAVSVRKAFDSETAISTFSYLFCVNSANFLSSSLIGESSFANFDIVSAVIENISRVDDYASMDLGANTENSLAPGGKYILPTNMSENDADIRSNKLDSSGRRTLVKTNHGISTSNKVFYTCVVSAVPVGIAIVGIVVAIKRRYL